MGDNLCLGQWYLQEKNISSSNVCKCWCCVGVCLAIFVEVLCGLFYNAVFITECIHLS